MPYEKISEIPGSLRGIEPPINLEQANLIASWADEIEQSDADVESPWAVAIAQFKKAYHTEDGERWVKNKPKTKDASLTARIRHVESAWRVKFGDGLYGSGIDAWPEEVFEDRVTVNTSRGLLAYPYTIQEDGAIVFGEPVQVKGRKGIRNKPIMKEVSLDALIRHVRDAWRAQFQQSGVPTVESVEAWPEEVFEDKLTVSTPRGIMAYPYTIDDDGIVTFGKPVQVKARKAGEPGTEVVQGALARFFESLTGFVTEAVQKITAKEDGSREAAREAQEKRSEKWGIAILETGSSLTIPKKYEDKGATFADFADSVNVKYPVWLTKSRDDLDAEQLGQVRNAPARFAQFKQNYDTKSRGIVGGRIEKALKKFKIGEYAEKSFFYPVVKGKDGKDWWVAFSGTAFEDLEREIISRKAIDFGIAYGDETGERGDLRLFHLPGSRVGSCEVQLREGCFLIEAGRWDETGVAVATKQTLRENPEAWKMSVGFAYNEDYFIGGTYEDQVIFLERSVVKANRAASPFTAILVSQEVDTMSTKDELLDLLGDQDLVDKVLNLAAEKTDELSRLVAFKQKSDGEDEATGMMAQIEDMSEETLKQVQDAIEAKLRVETQGGTAGPDKDAPSVVEISEEVIKAIADQVVLAVDFDAKLTAMGERLGVLAQTVEEQGSTVMGVKQLLEIDIDKEVKKRVEGLPAARFVLAERDKLYRPSQDSEDEPPAVPTFQSPLAAFGQIYGAMQSKRGG